MDKRAWYPHTLVSHEDSFDESWQVMAALIINVAASCIRLIPSSSCEAVVLNCQILIFIHSPLVPPRVDVVGQISRRPATPLYLPSRLSPALHISVYTVTKFTFGADTFFRCIQCPLLSRRLSVPHAQALEVRVRLQGVKARLLIPDSNNTADLSKALEYSCTFNY